eukprot:CAMPEP_0194397154 /NCGR_PEP_ID=MMETSP0174-20130528/125389_1 /TAXON_ID=216777 /ORGANISM="Proboscia alata, Strain PI-D3" /LENGTH=106 /DNA_ID=CAMNT_0039193305 /DNA_START=108 /DNA_END=425 /DNA_ORIENTATION=+
MKKSLPVFVALLCASEICEAAENTVHLPKLRDSQSIRLLDAEQIQTDETSRSQAALGTIGIESIRARQFNTPEGEKLQRERLRTDGSDIQQSDEQGRRLNWVTNMW